MDFKYRITRSLLFCNCVFSSTYPPPGISQWVIPSTKSFDKSVPRTNRLYTIMSFTDRYIFTGLERRNPENFLIDSPINVRGSDLDKFQENAASLHTWSNVPTQCPHTGSKGPQQSASHQLLWSHSCVVLNEFYVWNDFINIIYINIHMSRAMPRNTTLQHLWVTDQHQYNSLWISVIKIMVSHD